MTWHTVTVAREAMDGAVEQIRSSGGTVVRCRPMRTTAFVTFVMRRA